MTVTDSSTDATTGRGANVAVVDPETNKPTRVGYRTETVERDGRERVVRIRVAKSSGKDL